MEGDTRLAGRIRDLVANALQRHMYETAIFYADILVSMRNDNPVEDVYLLADCYYRNSEFHRAAHIGVRFPKALAESAQLRLLNAQALFACQKWDECLQFLNKFCVADFFENKCDYAAVCLLQGQIFEEHENQETARSWYKTALTYDPYCYDALMRLVGNFLLPKDEEIALVTSLAVHPEDTWLKCLILGRESLEDGETWAEVCPQAQKLRRKRRKEGTFATPEVPTTLCLVETASWKSYHSSRLYYEGDYEGCYRVSKKVLDGDPFYFGVLPVYIASLVMLERKTDVSHIAHKLLQAYPNSSVALFAAGCYYMMVGKLELARKVLHKATVYDPQFAPAWIAYGHSFASHEEADQAHAAYRAASRLFPGTHLPWLFLGMGYLRTNALQLAEQNLEYGRMLMPNDPILLNELGCVAYYRKEYRDAIELLQLAEKNTSKNMHIAAVFFQNLGHAFLQSRQLAESLAAFEKAHQINPRLPAPLAGIGYLHHLMRDVHRAIEYYHRALAQCRDQEFVSEMLKKAVEEAAELDTVRF